MKLPGIIITIAIIITVLFATNSFVISGKATESGINDALNLSKLTLNVNIPCPGHAGLIVYEIKKLEGISNVDFKYPNIFEVNYDSNKTSEQEILSLEIFSEYAVRRV